MHFWGKMCHRLNNSVILQCYVVAIICKIILLIFKIKTIRQIGHFALILLELTALEHNKYYFVRIFPES